MSYEEPDFDEPEELSLLRARMSPKDRIRTFVEIYGREPEDEDELDMFIDEYTLELYNSQTDVGDDEFGPSL